MWSRTVTLNTRLPLAVGDGVTERGQAALRQARHDAGQLGERRLARDERVERRIAQQAERQRQPVGGRPAPGARRRQRADLARANGKAALVERAAEGQPDLAVAVPAQL